MDLNAFVGPAWYCALALVAVLGDAFLPFLPSGTLVILAVLKTGQVGGSPLLLAAGVAVASFLGDLLLLNLARRGAPAVHRGLARRPRLAESVERVQQALTGRTTSRAAAAIVIIARFVPAGRTVLDVAVGHSTNHRPWTFLRWSAVAGVVWAAYIVTLGWLNQHWFDTAWLSFAISCLAATAISSAVVQLLRRRRRLAVLVEGESSAVAPATSAFPVSGR
ncbi:DedA family protein [Kitasatospora phosalacinea]|uniref:DedA family protein n=1 Tax=Kitasatospora phosalacinea TaxID=2065 RepID=UPI00364C6C76